MTPDEVTIGLLLKVIAPRWDGPLGRLARVTDTGRHSLGGYWWFTVEWLIWPRNRSPHSLRMWEEDLQTFEVVPDAEPLLMRREESDGTPLARLSQITLPFPTDAHDD